MWYKPLRLTMVFLSSPADTSNGTLWCFGKTIVKGPGQKVSANACAVLENLNGNLDEVFDALITADQALKLAAESAEN